MSGDGHDVHTEQSVDTGLRPVDAACVASSYPAMVLKSEALAHLQVQWEQFNNRVLLFKAGKSGYGRTRLLDDLKRVRNTLVVLEKPALEYVVRELLEVLKTGDGTDTTHDPELADLLVNAVNEIGQQVSLMQENVALDNALALIPLVNDCRACREDMLLSDSLMLTAGITLSKAQPVSAQETQWADQRQIWIDFATSRHSVFANRTGLWMQNRDIASLVNLLAELESFELLTDSHQHLNSLTPLFQSAAIVATAVQQRQLRMGAALRSLFMQLEQNVQRCALVAVEDDLLPDDLLRNLLYYVAQSNSDSDTALGLQRRFRLDRVRHVTEAERPRRTPTIGVVYHLTNAIRCTVTRETELLRAWLDSSDNEEFPKVGAARLRFRLGQLQHVLSIMGNMPSLQRAKAVGSQLQNLCSKPAPDPVARTRFLNELLELDSLLEQSARRSVLGNRIPDSAQLLGDDVYIDMATDACLREARYDLQQCADELMLMLKSDSGDAAVAHRIVQMLGRADHALQILPLPEVSPLIRWLLVFTDRLPEYLKRASSNSLHSLIDDADEGKGHSLHDKLQFMLASLDSYLGCVLHPQPATSQFLTEAQEILERIRSLPEAMSSTIDLDPVDRENPELSAEFQDNDLSLSDVESLTLHIDDDLLLEPLEEGIRSYSNSVALGSASIQECFGHLDSLEESVGLALTPSADGSRQLPNEQMLRALHALTQSAQSINASDALVISQPLQRAALALFREGRYFNAEQTRIIGDLTLVLRSRLHALNEGRSIEDVTSETEELIDVFLSRAAGNVRRNMDIASTRPTLTISSQVSSLNDVFASESSLILEKLQKLVSRTPFDKASVNEALALLHTLKGSARMAGKGSICDCAHRLESEIHQCDSLEKCLTVLKNGYVTLQDYQLQSIARQGTESLAGSDDASPGLREVADDVSLVAVDSGVDSQMLLELSANVSSTQLRLGDELERLRMVCNDVQTSVMRWRELRQSGDLPDSPAFREMIADMESSRMTMLDVMQQAGQQHLQASTLSALLHDRLLRSRLVRIDSIRDRLTDTINDIASLRGVEARLQISGGELLVEKCVYSQLVAPLEHLARNAVVHGIESIDERKSSDKNAVGLVSLQAHLDGTELVLRFSDDGRGVSRAIARMSGDRSGLADDPTPKDLEQLLFSAGFSSLREADAIAGHGLGLAAVKTLVQRMNGKVELDNSVAVGFCIVLRIPLALIVSQVIVVQCGDRVYGIPHAQIKSTSLETAAADEQDGLNNDNADSDSVTRLQDLLGDSDAATATTAISTVEKPYIRVEIAGKLLFLEVDNIIGYRDLLVHPLGAQMASLGYFSGGSVLSSGEQVLVVDMSALLDDPEQLSSSSKGADIKAGRNGLRPQVLVVDDSPTIRASVKSLLQDRGLDVLTCRDGIEALECLACHIPQIMLIDLEMPRMDGLTLTRRMRAKYPDSTPPFIMMSNQDTSSNRELARSLGAAVFLAKPFREKRLLDAVQSTGLRLPDVSIA